MTFQNKKIKTVILSISLLVLALIPLSNVHSQEVDSELIITWQAQNFYPSDYQGKANIAEDNSVLISAMGTLDNQVIDLSNAEFSWYIDNNLYENSVGASEIIFDADKNSGNSYFIRVVVRSENVNFEKSFNISVREQEVVIENNSPSNSLSQNEEIILKSTPYFFNISSIDNLSFFWEINGILQDTRERFISINSENEYINSNQNIIKSIISNNQSPTESKRKTIQLIGP